MKLNYEELEAKCAALAAENAGLKNAITAVSKTSEECEINGDELKYVVEPSEFDALTDLLDETPATDAFLAEVRAQGVEMLTSKLQSLIDEGNFEGDEIGVIAGAVYTGADIAAQIRRGVQS